MKLTNHRISTAALVYAFTCNIPGALIAAFTSIFPDWLEGRGGDPGSAKQIRWQKRHRQGSHWFVPYLIAAVVSFAAPAQYAWIAGYAFIGCLGHIAEDVICGQVPGINPKKRVGIKLFYVGTVTEYLITIAICILPVARWYI